MAGVDVDEVNLPSSSTKPSSKLAVGVLKPN